MSVQVLAELSMTQRAARVNYYPRERGLHPLIEIAVETGPHIYLFPAELASLIEALIEVQDGLCSVCELRS